MVTRRELVEDPPQADSPRTTLLLTLPVAGVPVPVPPFYCLLPCIAALMVVALPAVGAADKQAQPVTLVAIQMQVRLEDYRSPAAFATAVERHMKEAMRAPGEGPRLVVFPEDVGLALVVIGEYEAVKDCSSWKEAAGVLIAKHQAEVAETAARHHCSPVRALFLLKGERARQVYADTFAKAAKAHRVTLVAGSAALPDAKGNVFNTSYVFGPTGKLLGSQRKAHLIDLEGPEGLDLTPAPLDAIHALDTPAGRLGLGICYDLFFPDVVEKLVKEGSRILVQPTFNPQPWDAAQQEEWKKGIWTAASTHPTIVAGVNPMMVGSLWEVTAEGVSSIVGPPFAPPATGYLAQASSATKGAVISAQVALPTR
jgi:predicted amidohydrolase